MSTIKFSADKFWCFKALGKIQWILTPSTYNLAFRRLKTFKTTTVTIRGKRQEGAARLSTVFHFYPTQEWRCAANNLPRPALLPRSYERDQQTAPIPWKRSPHSTDRNGTHARQVRELLPLVLAATYQTVPTFPSSYLLPTQATKNYFFKKLLVWFFFFWGGWGSSTFFFHKNKNGSVLL